MYPNGIAVGPDGMWIAEQKSDNVVLTDWEGKLLKTVKTPSKNSSGIAFGGGHIWMAANRDPQGIFELDPNGKLISHWQIPLGPKENGGGCHGVEYVDGKLYIAALRLRGILRVDAKTWQPEFFISYNVPRAHGMAYDKRDNSIWLVTGLADGSAGLIQYDAATGRTCRRSSSKKGCPIRTVSRGTTARCTAATPAFIQAGPTTSHRHTDIFSGSTSCSRL